MDESGNASVAASLSPPDAVATLLESFSAACRGSYIEIVWRLGAYDEEATFIVMRAESGGTVFEELAGVPDRDRLTFAFKDSDIKQGTSYRYRVEYVFTGRRVALFETGIIATPALPLTLYQNHPDPFNPATTIRYYLPRRAHVAIDVYDVSGRLVARLVHGEQQQGHNSVRWDGRDSNGAAASSGLYFYRLTAGKERFTRKMVLLR